MSAQEFSAEPTSKKRRLCQYYGPEPSVEEIEGEFWRIVETPDEVSDTYIFLSIPFASLLLQRYACFGPANMRLCECSRPCLQPPL